MRDIQSGGKTWPVLQTLLLAFHLSTVRTCVGVFRAAKTGLSLFSDNMWSAAQMWISTNACEVSAVRCALRMRTHEWSTLITGVNMGIAVTVKGMMHAPADAGRMITNTRVHTHTQVWFGWTHWNIWPNISGIRPKHTNINMWARTHAHTHAHTHTHNIPEQTKRHTQSLGSEAANVHQQNKTQTKRHPVSWNTTPLNPLCWEQPVNTHTQARTHTHKICSLYVAARVFPCGPIHVPACVCVSGDGTGCAFRVLVHVSLSVRVAVAGSVRACVRVCVCVWKTERREGEQMIE